LSSHRLSECGFSTATGEARCAVTRSTQRASQGNAATITAQITSQLYWLHRSVSDAIISAQVSAMRHDYDIFEKFPDGSTIWRACISGRYETERKLHELAEQSNNEFYAIDIQVNQLVALGLKSASRSAAKAAANG